MGFTNYDQAIEWLQNDLPKTDSKVFKGSEGLQQSMKILSMFGNPQNVIPAIHVAGTSGKGTTASMISTLLVESDKQVGLILSPHVYDVRERCQIDGELISKEVYLGAINEFEAKLNALTEQGLYPSYYEATILISFNILSKNNLDYIVVETGLGGMLDTTNTIDREDKISVITKIGMDHMNILGNTIEEIAIQKAGIMTVSGRAFAIKQDQKVMDIFSRQAIDIGANLEFVEEDLTLEGPKHTKENKSLAIRVVEYISKVDRLKLPDDKDDLLTRLQLPGRFEVANYDNVTVVFDGAHNQQKLSALIEEFQLYFGDKKAGVVVAFGRSEKARKGLSILESIAKEFVFTSFDSKRSDMKIAPPSGRTLSTKIQNRTIHDYDDIAKHVKNSEQKLWVVTGAFYVLEPIRAALDDLYS